jgi:hypothetical protein
LQHLREHDWPELEKELRQLEIELERVPARMII